MGNGIDEYARRFARLRTNRNRKVWSGVTAGQAPHKPLLLLCVLDLFDSGRISSNLVEITDDLTQLFGRYWERVLPFGRPGNLALPFFHLQDDGFWRLLPRHEGARIGPQITSLARLRGEVIGARLDERLYELILSKENRERLRSVLIETYFSPETRGLVFEQGAINRGAFVYSEELLRRPEDTRVEEALPVEEAYRPAVCDQGFRRDGRHRVPPPLRPVRHPRPNPRRTHGGRGGTHSPVERDARRPPRQRHGPLPDVPLGIRRGAHEGVFGVRDSGLPPPERGG